MPPVLAIDLGGTKTAFARVDENGTIIDRRMLPAANSFESSVAQIAAAGEDERSIGLIVPGIYTPSTGRAWCPNLWGTDEVPLLAALRDRLNARIAIDSDRSGYVLGEAWLGAARGLRDVVFVAIGTGIGAGILSDGRIVRGAHGIAGAVGWFGLDSKWDDIYRQCGCWESHSAGPGIARRAGRGDAKDVVASARRGDGSALAVLDRAAAFAGTGIANLISALDPEAVVLGGGLMVGAGDLLIHRIRSEVLRWAQPISASRCRIELTQLGETAGLLGAARLALDGN